MISAPSENREEAISLPNKLMKGIQNKGKVLKRSFDNMHKNNIEEGESM